MKQSVINKQQSFPKNRSSLSNHNLLSKRPTVPVVCVPVTWWLFGHNVCIQLCPTLCSLDLLFNLIYLLEAAKLCCISKFSLPCSSSSIRLSPIPLHTSIPSWPHLPHFCACSNPKTKINSFPSLCIPFWPSPACRGLEYFHAVIDFPLFFLHLGCVCVCVFVCVSPILGKLCLFQMSIVLESVPVDHF